MSLLFHRAICAGKISYLIYRQVGRAYAGLQSLGQRGRISQLKYTGQIQLEAKTGIYN